MVLRLFVRPYVNVCELGVYEETTSNAATNNTTPPPRPPRPCRPHSPPPGTVVATATRKFNTLRVRRTFRQAADRLSLNSDNNDQAERVAASAATWRLVGLFCENSVRRHL
jgi:hypothetical protein